MITSRITKIKLVDGKEIWYPTDIELKQLGDEIVEVRVEEQLTREQFEAKYYVVRSEKPAVLDKAKYWICNTCGKRHAEDYVCTMLRSE
jgi:rubrerythrin